MEATNQTNQGKHNFEYKYSAKRQQEIENIRRKYAPMEEDKLETLKRLDKEASRPGTIASLAVGIIGSLIMGVGMSCVMVWTETLFVPGILLGLLGMGIAASAYPLYKKITKKQQAKVADRILALSEELAA